MSNGTTTQLERLWKLQTQVGRLVMEGKRDPRRVADALQAVLDWNPVVFTTESMNGDSSDSRFKVTRELDVVIPEGYGIKEGGRRFYRMPTELVSGQRIKLEIIRLTTSVSPQECLIHLLARKAHLVGSWGFYFIPTEQYKRGQQMLSFDGEEALFVATHGGEYKVPVACREESDGLLNMSSIPCGTIPSYYRLLCFRV